MEFQETTIIQRDGQRASLEKEQNSGLILSNFKTYYKATAIKTS